MLAPTVRCTQGVGGALVAVIAVVSMHLAAQTPPAAAPCTAAQDTAFGATHKLAVGVEGKIYFLPENTRELPDFDTLRSEGSLYADRWDIPVRNFTAGFPGITERFEWFAIDYRGSIYVPVAGEYAFRLLSDDGSKLFLDDALVVNNDGTHAMTEASGQKALTIGDHRFRLSYFQGPATEIGLRLLVTPPGGDERVFRLQDFHKDVLTNGRLLGATETAREIRVRMGSEVLFDTAKFDLKPAAQKALKQLASVLEAYPGRPILIEGHTDSVGNDQYNQELSLNRAHAVADWLTTQADIAPGCITTRGFGKTKPVADNGTAEGRQKNRRVEISVQKGGS